jgi:hypothetical protein
MNNGNHWHWLYKDKRAFLSCRGRPPQRATLFVACQPARDAEMSQIEPMGALHRAGLAVAVISRGYFEQRSFAIEHGGGNQHFAQSPERLQSTACQRVSLGTRTSLYYVVTSCRMDTLCAAAVCTLSASVPYVRRRKKIVWIRADPHSQALMGG